MLNRERFFKNLVIIAILFFLITTSVSASFVQKTKNIQKITIEENKENLTKTFQESLEKTNFVKQFLKNEEKQMKVPTGLFSTVVKTTCNNVEKTTEVFFGFKNKIDVDNNPETGVNGKDIQVQYLLLPWLDFSDGIGLGLAFTLNVVKIGDEIDSENLSISLQTAWKGVSFGFWSPKKFGNTIPDSVSLSFGLIFYLNHIKHGFSISLNPEYDEGNQDKEIVLFSEYKKDNERRIHSLHFDPAIETQVDVFSTKNDGEWVYSFEREASVISRVTSTFSRISGNEHKNTSFIIDKLPDSISFSLGLTPFRQGGGSFVYESSESYDIELIVESNQIGICRYGSITNTPTRLYAEWDPSLSDGYYSMDINSESTDFAIMNSLTNPSVNLKVNDLSLLDFDAHWNLSNPGEFVIERETDFIIDLDFQLLDWNIDFYGKPVASYFYTKWLVNVTGFLEIDTNWQSLSQADLLIKSADLGVRTNAETLKAEDFRIDWTIWPPKDWNIEKQGEIDFADIEIDIFYNDAWYHIWPI